MNFLANPNDDLLDKLLHSMYTILKAGGKTWYNKFFFEKYF